MYYASRTYLCHCNIYSQERIVSETLLQESAQKSLNVASLRTLSLYMITRYVTTNLDMYCSLFLSALSP
jgi:hypothetical protein